MTQTNTLLTNEALADLEAGPPAPCLSLYQPTHRHHPENQQDPIRYGNLVNALETSLLQRHSPSETQRLLTNDALRERVWQTVEPHYTAKLKHWADEFAVAKSKGLGVDELTRVAAAAAAGQIATLLIEDGRQIPGRITAATGQVQLAELGDPEVDDVLDDLGQLVHRKGGRTVLVPAEYMPTDTGIAATCRF